LKVWTEEGVLTHEADHVNSVVVERQNISQILTDLYHEGHA